MKNVRHKIFRLLTLLALGWMGAACSSEKLQEPPAPWSPTDGVPTLTVSLGVEGATKSSEDEDFEPGTGYENYLDIAGNDYRIYFFDANNKYLATFEPYLKPSANVPIEDGISYYNFMGKVPSNVGTNFKLVVLANWSTYPVEVAKEDATEGSFQLIKGETTIEYLTTHSATQFEALTSPGENDWLGPGRLIPFYGVRAYTLTDDNDSYGVNKYIGADGKLKGDIYVDLTDDPLPMLRAMAKVEVILDNAFASFSSVKMTRYNSYGYCAPYKEKEDDKWYFDYNDYFLGYDWETAFFRGVHLVNGKNDNDSKELEFKKVSSRTEGEGNTILEKEKWVAYVPEYKNIGVEDFTTIEVELKKPDNITEEEWAKIEGDKKKKTIYFATNGSKENNEKSDVRATKTVAGRYNIERNNIYRFTIKDMAANLDCKVDIQPFAEQKLEMEFGLMRDERGDLMVIPDSYGKLPDYFIKYMDGREWPKDKDGNELKQEPGDYYAIVLGEDGKIGSNQTEVWLKDSEECRVLSNFANKNDDSQECSTRAVIHFFGLEEIEYNKDIQGERRLHHYPNHWTIVLDNEGAMIFKDPDNETRYRVESWDESDGCWIISKEVISTDKKTITTTLTLIDDVGNISNTIKEITEDYFEFKSKDDSSQ